MPISDITVRTSAKSTLIMPGQLMISAMPATAPCSTSLAARNASSTVMSSPSTCISLSFGMTISESTCSLELIEPLLRDLLALAFERERLGDHRDGQDAELLRDLRDHRRRAGAGAAAHAGGQEEHVGAAISSAMRSRSSIGGGAPDLRDRRPRPGPW